MRRINLQLRLYLLPVSIVLLTKNHPATAPVVVRDDWGARVKAPQRPLLQKCILSPLRSLSSDLL